MDAGLVPTKVDEPYPTGETQQALLHTMLSVHAVLF